MVIKLFTELYINSEAQKRAEISHYMNDLFYVVVTKEFDNGWVWLQTTYRLGPLGGNSSYKSQNDYIAANHRSSTSDSRYLITSDLIDDVELNKIPSPVLLLLLNRKSITWSAISIYS